MKSYVTFGQSHRHLINGKVFDKDCVAVVNGDREKVFEIFGRRFCCEYLQQEFEKKYNCYEKIKRYFPRGLIKVDYLKIDQIWIDEDITN